MAAETHLYLQIAEALRRRILSGNLGPGERLPPVRSLALQWGCTPGTVGRAYQVLAREGLVVGQRGRGTRVADRLLTALAPPMQWADLVNRAERFLLESLAAGHTATEVETAITLAAARWRAYQSAPSPEGEMPNSGPPAALRFAGSHDLLIERLRPLLRERLPNLAFSVDYRGSLGGLIALAREEADLAGTHLWDASTDEYNLPFVQRILPGFRVILLTLAYRQLGLILPAGNPQRLKGLQDLVGGRVQFANRQLGSGTRVWFEAQLRRLGVSSAEIAGFASQETTHLAVARAVAVGEAGAGLGIYAAAASAGLDFVPLTRERYDLVIPARLWEQEAIRVLIEVLGSASFREAVATLGGYEVEAKPREVWVG